MQNVAKLSNVSQLDVHGQTPVNATREFCWNLSSSKLIVLVQPQILRARCMCSEVSALQLAVFNLQFAIPTPANTRDHYV